MVGEQDTVGDQEDRAVARGRSEGLAAAALALACVSFVNLLGAEKPLLAIILAAAALRGSRSLRASARARWAIGIAGVYLLTLIVVLVAFHDRLAELIRLLARLG
ncbi:MAG: hypothetical protein ACM3YM_07195 [Sphingomonadales bacterium]